MNAANPRAMARNTMLLAALSIALTEGAVAAAAPLPVLLVIPNQDFHYAEYRATRTSLEARGLSVVVAAGEARDALPQESGIRTPVRPDVLLSNSSAHDYSAVVFVGGWGASSYQYAFEGHYYNIAYQPRPVVTREVNRLINEFIASDKPVAGVCHGVTVLAWARVDGASPLRGHVVVGPAGGLPAFRYDGIDYPDAQQPARWQVERNGATMLTAYSVGNPLHSQDDVWVDGRIITAQDYQSSGRMADLLKQQLDDR